MYNGEQDVPVQKISAGSLAECKEKLFKMFGHEYTIRGKRQILHGGFLGLGQKEWVEVTYSVNNGNDNHQYAAAQPQKTPEDEIAAFKKNRDDFLKAAAVSNQMTTLDTKFSELQTNLTKQIQSIAVSADKHPTIKKIEELLAENEFTYSFISTISDRIKSSFSLEALDDFKKVERTVVDWIGESISIIPERAVRPPHVVVIVGPTGVGKTTTITKFAVKMVMDAKKAHYALPELCIVTIDSMRVGAYEQISKYGEIIGTQVQKAESVDDMKKIYEEKKDCADAIFIDTSGYSPNDSVHIGEMKSLLQIEGLNPDVYLSVAASTKARDLENIMENYEPFHYNSVIVTKCDESHQYGNIISVLNTKHKSMSYITDGQYVTRNLRRAHVIDFLINLSGFDVDRVHIEDLFGEK
jgi:flagellar biosynthesis protein FlhF